MRADGFRKIVLVALAGVALAAPAASAEEQAGLPPGWFVGGTTPELYSLTVADDAPCGQGRAAVLRATQPNEKGAGTMMQLFEANAYRGKRVRFSAALRTKDVQGWAGLWMRVDGGADPEKPLAFDNMQGRALTGTRECHRYDVVLDVAPEAARIGMGLLLSGTGEVWIQGIAFDVVDATVPTTDLLLSGSPPVAAAPANLTLAAPASEDKATGRVGRIWFNGSTVSGFLSRKADGSFQAREGDEHVAAAGNRVQVKSGAYSGELTVERIDGRTVITGSWGSWVKYPVRIVYDAKEVSMKWGFYERALKREDGPQTPAGCADYTRNDGGPRAYDALQLCGEVLSERPSPAQTVIAFLWNGFRRGGQLKNPGPGHYDIPDMRRPPRR